MREMLEPVFGETGAIIAQFVITLVVVLLLILVVVWLVRRYSGGAFTAGGRGRLPRLAIVDAMAVDNRRRLVLVRRDNVEHLLLIGGPSDIVVEPAILRTRTAAARTPQQVQAGATAGAPVPSGPAPARIPPAARVEPARAEPAVAAAPQPAAPEPAVAETAEPAVAVAAAAPRHGRLGVDQPIPFPPRRSQATPVRPAARREPPPMADEPEPAYAEALGRSRFAPIAPPAAAVAEAPAPAEPVEEATDIGHIFAANEEAPSLHDREPEAPADEPAFHPVVEEEPGYAPAAAEEGGPELAAAESVASEEAPPEVEAETGGPAVTRVSDLEREMARLLGEISGRRS